MKKTIAIALTAVLVLCLAGCSFGINGISHYSTYADAGKYSIGSFTYEAADVKTVEINWVSGEIEIVESEGDLLSVTENGEELDSEEQMHYYLRGGKLIIHYCESGYSRSIDEKYKKLRVEIPSGVDVDIDNVNADIDIGEMTLGELDIANVSGNINFSQITAEEIDIEIVSGKIFAEEMNVGSFSADGVSGDIALAKISADKIDVQIVSGKTELELLKKCNIDISGVSGSVKLVLPAEMGAEIEFSSVSGDIRSDLKYTKNEKVYTFGNGEIDVDIETVSGNVYVE